MFGQRQLNSRCRRTLISKAMAQKIATFFQFSIPALCIQSRVISGSIEKRFSQFSEMHFNWISNNRLLIVKKNSAEFRILLGIGLLKRYLGQRQSPDLSWSLQYWTNNSSSFEAERVYFNRFPGDFRLIHSTSRYSNHVKLKFIPKSVRFR